MKNLSEAPVKKERICRKALPPGVAKVLFLLGLPPRFGRLRTLAILKVLSPGLGAKSAFKSRSRNMARRQVVDFIDCAMQLPYISVRILMAPQHVGLKLGRIIRARVFSFLDMPDSMQGAWIAVPLPRA